MRRSTIAAGLTAAVISGAAVAVPAVASSGTPATVASTSASSSTPGLTASQEQTLDQFLAVHPQAAAALGNRLDAWKRFADANPAVVAELRKVAALPQEQRKSELQAWLKANPTDAKAWQAFRQQVRDARKDRREARKNRRADRKGATATPSPTAT